MIQINLLPVEHRRAETSVLPLFVTFLFGLVAVSSLAGWYFSLSNDYNAELVTKRKLDGEKREWTKKKEQVDEIENDTKLMERRQQTIINISRSKVVWSQKLDQLSKIFQSFPDFRTRKMTMDQKQTGGRFILDCSSVGDNFDKVAEFQEVIQKDAKFYFHFIELLAPRFVRVPETDDEPERLNFTLTLTIKSFANETKKKPGRR